MAISPNTILYLLKSPIELDNLNQLTFANKQAQESYFLSLPKLEVDKITYQRKDSVIRFPAHIDSIIEYNYVMYQNSNYTNKWFYAFIEHMEYVSDTCTLITIKTDVYQTWMFDIQIKRSFVIREHTNNDTVGRNTVYEGLETGEFIINTNGSHQFSYLNSDIQSGESTGENLPDEQLYVIGVTRDPTNNMDKIYGYEARGLFSGVKYYVAENATNMITLLKAYAAGGYSDDVVSLFVAPAGLCILSHSDFNSHTYSPHAGETYTYSISDCKEFAPSYFSLNYMQFDKPTSIKGYTPRNKKLLTGEFCYIYATNFVGSAVKYNYEYFTNAPKFMLSGVLCPGCSIEMTPDEYQGFQYDRTTLGTFALPAGKLPVCNWNSDQYTNWLAQNGVNRALSYVTSAGSIVVGGALVATGAGSLVGAGMIAGGIGGIVNQAASDHQHSFAPNANNGSLNSSDINYSHSRCFGIYDMCVKEEFARKIDSIFDAVGYKTNEMKIPNVTGRRNWNYVQTRDVAITGNVPQEDLQEIKDMFNNGVTFWHNPATFLDYSQSNGII